MVKGMLGTLIGTVFGGETLRQVGVISGMSEGLKKGTESFVSLGVLGNAIKNTKSRFN